MDKVMVGGAEFQKSVIQWTRQSSNLFNTIFGTLLVLFAIYPEKLPANLRWQLSTTIGKGLLLLTTYLIYTTAGWIPAILFSIGVALVWANRPLFKPVSEGFHDSVKVTPVAENRWFVEKVLLENPKAIIQDRVTTRAVQEENTTGGSRTSR